jgi:hypothetical protein
MLLLLLLLLRCCRRLGVRSKHRVEIAPTTLRLRHLSLLQPLFNGPLYIFPRFLRLLFNSLKGTKTNKSFCDFMAGL